MALTTGQYPSFLKPIIEKAWGDSDPYINQLYPKVFEVRKSNDAYEQDVALSTFGLPSIKTEGGNYVEDTSGQLWTSTVEHTEYSLGFSITEKAMEDLKDMPLAQKGTEWLKRSMYKNMDVVAFNLFNNATSTTFGDGKELASTTQIATTGSYSNYVSSDVSELSLETAVIAILQYKDDRGLFLNLAPQNIVIPPASIFLANRLLRSTARVGTADNDTNALKQLGFLQKDPIVSPYISDTDSWALITNADNGLVFYERVMPQIATDNDFITGNMLIKSRSRFAATIFNKRAVYYSDGA